MRQYLKEIGRRGGGRASRRALDPETARRMVAVREARKAFRRFHPLCFRWSPPDLVIGMDDVPWVADQVMERGNREAWLVGRSLCR